MTDWVVFRIRRQYFDQIVAGTKRLEVRRLSPHWLRVLGRITYTDTEYDDAKERWTSTLRIKPDVGGVFVCGKAVHRRRVTRVEWAEKAEMLLGRPLSEQGRKDVGRGHVLGFTLGDALPDRRAG